MKKKLLLSFLCFFIFSQNIIATPVDVIKKNDVTKVFIQPKKKKKKKKKRFFTRMAEKFMKRRIGKMIKKLKLDASECVRIVKKNGEEIMVLIVKIGEDRIRYKTCDFQNGPTRSIRKEDIFMIKYADGKTELVAEERLKKKKSEAANQENVDYKQFWNIGFILGILFTFFALIILAIALRGKKREHALRGALAGVLTAFLISISFLLLLFSLL